MYGACTEHVGIQGRPIPDYNLIHKQLITNQKRIAVIKRFLDKKNGADFLSSVSVNIELIVKIPLSPHALLQLNNVLRLMQPYILTLLQ